MQTALFFKCPKCKTQTSIPFLIDGGFTDIDTTLGHYLICPKCNKKFNVDKMFERGHIYRKPVKEKL